MRRSRLALATILSILALAFDDTSAQQPASAISGAQKLMAVPASRYPGHVYVLPATMETTQWGWFDNAEPPRLVIDSGDTVVVETMSHSHGRLWPGATIEELKKLRTDWPGRGPMSLTGPIFVKSAEPGDTLRIRIQKIVPRSWAANFNVPGMFGQFPKEFPEGQVKYFYLDADRKIAEFAPGLEIPLRPFPGTLGVRAPSRAATTPFRPGPSPATWTTAILSKARRCSFRCSFAAHWCGPATRMRRKAMAKSTSRHWKPRSRKSS